MAQRIQWLNQASFEGRIRLPEKFDLSIFDQYILEIEELELRAVLGSDRQTRLHEWVIGNPVGVPVAPVDGELDEVIDTDMLALYAQVVPFLVYACYAEYILQGDVQPTDTGAVTKERDSSMGLSDVRIMQLYRSYRSKAEVRLNDVRQFVARDDQSCTLPQTYGPRISSSRGRTGSLLDNF